MCSCVTSYRPESTKKRPKLTKDPKICTAKASITSKFHPPCRKIPQSLPVQNRRLLSYLQLPEGIDQTRGWFYTLLVISTALFNKPPFKNLNCTGLVLAADGQKTSKRKKI
ncbi:isoleucyl tRNA synthetase [Culex quinquefasciatus]|uniref:Isoleucyl tRNA synthetase n=1 Tax=Culex quinquefasciatus TaxID=7176 RepID=B0WER5_CULQU|nr:isoleucyl tRNA synthetase [Culex quinquefasciatus]|eukprot:XP_001847199.1 isoleucyl tRNA synthetase [Culex quinquefasciatus]